MRTKKRCIKCKRVKRLSEFHVHSVKADGRRSDCKDCRRADQARRMSDPVRRAAQVVYLQEWRASTQGRARQLLKTAQYRSEALDVPFGLSLGWIVERLDRGVCEVTGLPFDMGQPEGTRHNPRAPSLDRIRPTKGYTKTNVRVVVWQFNSARNEYGDAALLELAQAIVSQSKRRRAA